MIVRSKLRGTSYLNRNKQIPPALLFKRFSLAELHAKSGNEPGNLTANGLMLSYDLIFIAGKGKHPREIPAIPRPKNGMQEEGGGGACSDKWADTRKLFGGRCSVKARALLSLWDCRKCKNNQGQPGLVLLLQYSPSVFPRTRASGDNHSDIWSCVNATVGNKEGPAWH